MIRKLYYSLLNVPLIFLSLHTVLLVDRINKLMISVHHLAHLAVAQITIMFLRIFQRLVK